MGREANLEQTVERVARAPLRRGDLIHYGAERLTDLIRRDQQTAPQVYGKPEGLWVSVLGRDDWPSWCRAEAFRNTRAESAARIVLRDDARVLRISTAVDLLAFHRTFYETIDLRIPTARSLLSARAMRFGGINWRRCAEQHQGLIIAPYIWSMRMHTEVSWYYTWDCASGCIWDPDAVARIELLRAARLAP